MKTYKLRFDAEVKFEHEIIIETELSEDALNDLLDELDFSDSNLDDAAYLLEQTGEVVIKELTEGLDPYEWGMECTDYDEVNSVENS